MQFMEHITWENMAPEMLGIIIETVLILGLLEVYPTYNVIFRFASLHSKIYT